MVHVGFDGVDEARVKLLGLVKDEQSLGAAQHHVSDGLPQLALETAQEAAPLKITEFFSFCILIALCT